MLLPKLYFILLCQKAFAEVANANSSSSSPIPTNQDHRVNQRTTESQTSYENSVIKRWVPAKRESIVLVAHGEPQTGAFSNPKIKTITRSGELLGFDQAREYMASPSVFSLRPSTSFGELSEVIDEDCEQLFGRVPTGLLEGPLLAFQDTGLRLGGRPNGFRIFVLRRRTLSFAQLGVMASWYAEIILLACRSNDEKLPNHVRGRNVS